MLLRLIFSAVLVGLVATGPASPISLQATDILCTPLVNGVLVLVSTGPVQFPPTALGMGNDGFLETGNSNQTFTFVNCTSKFMNILSDPVGEFTFNYG
jgi:hypothetical protein